MPSKQLKFPSLDILNFLILIHFLSLISIGYAKPASDPMLGSEECFNQFQDSIYKPHPDMHLRTDEVIRKYGYKVEIHNVTSDDGYILTFFRIPGSSLSSTAATNKSVVFLNHGLLASGQCWLLQPGSRNLAFKLADENFDVWLGNSRGSSYSQGHVNLSTNDPRYWNFTWHEMAIYDIPKGIELIRNVTGQPKMYYVGHSMGTTEFFVTMSEFPKLNEYIASAVLYAPAAYLSHNRNIMRHIAPFGNEIKVYLDEMLRGKVDSRALFKQYFFGQSAGEICSYSMMACGTCSSAHDFIYGEDILQTNYTSFSLLYSLFPEVSSSKTMLHYAQLMLSGVFRQFDYGSPSGNELHYGPGVKVPPEYDLSKITAPIVMFWGENDNMVTKIDVGITASRLKPETLKENNRVNWDKWTHTDFIKGIDADKLVYDRTVHIFKNKLYG